MVRATSWDEEEHLNLNNFFENGNVKMTASLKQNDLLMASYILPQTGILGRKLLHFIRHYCGCKCLNVRTYIVLNRNALVVEVLVV